MYLNEIGYKLNQVKKPLEAFEIIKKPNQNSFKSLYDELIIIIRFFQILGFFPISRNKYGK